MINTKIKIIEYKDKKYFKNFEDNRAKIIKQRLDEIAEERLKQEEYKIADEEVRNKINSTYKILKKNTKEMTLTIADKYSENLGVVDKSSLRRGINLSNKYLKNKVMKIYEELNNISAYLRGAENTDYIFYYQDEQGNYYRKHIKSEEVKKYYKVNRNDADAFISSYETEVKRAFNGIEAYTTFSEHLQMFRQATESGLKNMNKKIKSGQMGFLYESFEYHLNKMGDSLEEDEKNGQVKNFISAHHNQSWFNKREESIAKSFLLSIGQKRWLAGGDVLNHQLKSSASFGVSSLGQLEVSASMLFNFCDKIINEDKKLTKEDIKNMVLFLNDIHNDLSSATVEAIDEKISESLDNIIKALKIN